jgi:hypothetical protein
VKPTRAARFLGACLLLACLTVAQATPPDIARPIRLRNETVLTPAQGPTLAVTAGQPMDGLFLVQCTGPIQPDWRVALEQSGLRVLHYVPEDAFVVRARGASPAALSALAFVRWVGPYRPEHKVFSGLRELAVRAPAGSRIPVKVLLSSAATASERALLRRWLAPASDETRWPFGFTLEGRIAVPRLADLARSPAVLWVEPAPKFHLLDEISTKLVAGDDNATGTRATVQAMGFDGRNVTVGVADSGLDSGVPASMHPDIAGRVDAVLYYGRLSNGSDEHSHGTHVAGIIAGNAAAGEADELGYLYGLGVAPAARLVAQRIFDGVGNYQAPPSSAALTRDALKAGALIGSNSWGDDTQGRYDISAAEFDALVRDADLTAPGAQPYILEFSAGNAGPGQQTMDSPAVGKNVIATGASQNNRFDFFIYADGQDTLADFSSRGPCEDGRIKPDITAPGTWIASLKSSQATDENAWAAISESYMYQGGTSQAGPHASGAAAVFVQYCRESITNLVPSPALVKAALIDAAVDMDNEFGTAPTPNMDEGWGRIDLTELIGAARRCEYIDQTARLRTGMTYEKRVIVSGTGEPLRITLAYTDVAGLPAALPALVNDLDLEVTAPDGLVYRGNQFESGESVAAATAFDSINNVEGVRLSAPVPGEYLIRVLARNVPEDARSETLEVDQDFALVVSGALPLPGVGTVIFDRGAYGLGAAMHVKLIDFDLAGTRSAGLQITSTTERKGEPVVLTEIGSSGVFTGLLAIAKGAATQDGRLQASHGDTIEALYLDASPAAMRTATTRADFQAPVLTGVGVTNRFGRMVVSWTTDEAASSIVRYGTNIPLNLTTTNAARVHEHAVALEALESGVTYRFDAISYDEAGNAATNDNGGLHFTFVAVPAAAVLLVDAYAHGVDDDSIPIPVTEYTDALDATGVSYEVWDVISRGTPTAADLKPYRVVIWRINDSFYDSTTLTTGQQTAIRAYVDGGGGFFMASMEILSRLGDVPFRRDVLKVAEFILNPSVFDQCPTCDEDHRVATIVGEDGDPVGNGIVMDLDYSMFPEFEFLGIGPDLSDTFRPVTNAVPVVIELDSERACGVRFPRTGEDSAGRVVFFSFPLEAVPMTGEAPNTRVQLVRQAINFLAPGLTGFGTVALDRASYAVPGRMTAEVADADLAGSGSVTVRFASDSMPAGVGITLSETARRGLFRGLVKLVPVDQPAGKALLRAADGDTLWVEYLDASSGSLLRAEAGVDTEPAVISSVSAEALYEDAIVTWETSEPTDALVQFFEGDPGFPINRTAYSPDFDFTHELSLNGLKADTLYRYQVVCRDEAGNVSVDDNHGQYFQLRTLKPLVAPWADTLDPANPGWSVENAEDSQAAWQLGVPNNGQETQAHSPVKAWGSNLEGGPIDYGETYLISPAIELSGGSRATLQFWHSYDFSERSAFDLLEVGQVMVVTNILSTPVALAEFAEFSFGWEKAEVDLTPYLGRVVFLVWSYQLLSFDFEETYARPGWLVDDVEVLVTGKVTGSLRVTNNLAQARFTVVGPMTRSGAGWESVFTELTVGEYVASWEPVPFYVTPAPKTNTLVGLATLQFAGNYTFPDANTNGISDLWEEHWFGQVDPARTASTDTDADAASDRAEFLAGTDPLRADQHLALVRPVVQAGGSVQLTWTTVPGRSYRVITSTDLRHWSAQGGWLSASGASLSQTVVPPAAANRYFQIEVRP